MDNPTLQALAREVVNQGLLQNWRFYAAMGAICLLSFSLSSYLGAYLKTRGKALATKADFDELLAQVRLTTTETEKIRQVIGFEDWSERELKTLRRVKLEELVTAIKDSLHRLERERVAFIDGIQLENEEPFAKVETLTLLYFPELLNDAEECRQAFYKFRMWLGNCRSKRLAGKAEAMRTGIALKELEAVQAAMADFTNQYTLVLGANRKLERRAGELMRETVGKSRAGSCQSVGPTSC